VRIHVDTTVDMWSLWQASNSTFVRPASSSSSSAVVSGAEMGRVDGRSTPATTAGGGGGGAGGGGGFDSYCEKRGRREAEPDGGGGLEARFSPPRLGQMPGHDDAAAAVVVRSSSSPVASANDNTSGGVGGGGGVYSLFGVSAADHNDFASQFSSVRGSNSHRPTRRRRD